MGHKLATQLLGHQTSPTSYQDSSGFETIDTELSNTATVNGTSESLPDAQLPNNSDDNNNEEISSSGSALPHREPQRDAEPADTLPQDISPDEHTSEHSRSRTRQDNSDIHSGLRSSPARVERKERKEFKPRTRFSSENGELVIELADKKRDTLAEVLRKLHDLRIKEEYEESGIDEQASFVRIKREKTRSKVYNLIQSLETNPPGSIDYNAAETLQLGESLHDTMSELINEENELETMSQPFQIVKDAVVDAQKQLYAYLKELKPSDLGGILDAVQDSSSMSERVPRAPAAVDNSPPTEPDTKRRTTSTAAAQPTTRAPRNVRSESSTSRTPKKEPIKRHRPWHPGDPHQDVPLGKEHKIETLWTGNQFRETEGEIEMSADRLFEYSDDEHIREKRRRDLGKFIYMPSDLERYKHRDIHSERYPAFARPDLGYLVSRWTLEAFTRSWLEFSHFTWLSEQYQIIRTITKSLGYIHLETLVRCNWFIDESDLDYDYDDAQSIAPSLSRYSTDIPRNISQLFLHNNGSESDDVQLHRLYPNNTRFDRTESYPSSQRTRDRRFGSNGTLSSHIASPSSTLHISQSSHTKTQDHSTSSRSTKSVHSEPPS